MKNYKEKEMKEQEEKGMSINNCNFEAVVWDKKAVESIQTVAQALLNLTELFKTTNVTIECLLKLENPMKTPEFKKKS